MTKYLMVAVCHELRPVQNDDRLMSKECERRFRAEIAPSITSNTLIIFEGMDTEGLVSPRHPGYCILYEALFGESLNGTLPVLLGVDPRPTGSSIEEANAGAELVDEWEHTVKLNVLTNWREGPRTFAEVMERLRAGPPPARLVEQPSDREIGLAQRVYVDTRRFDRRHVEALRIHGQRFDQCLFIGGSTHAMALALQTNHPITFLSEEEEAEDLYFAYLGFSVWPELFFRGPYPE